MLDRVVTFTLISSQFDSVAVCAILMLFGQIWERSHFFKGLFGYIIQIWSFQQVRNAFSLQKRLVAVRR